MDPDMKHSKQAEASNHALLKLFADGNKYCYTIFLKIVLFATVKGISRLKQYFCCS